MNGAAPLRVLQVTDTLGVGGAETWLMAMLRYWSRTGSVQLDFLSTSGRAGHFDAEAQSLGAKVHYVQYGRRELKSFVPNLRRVLRAGNYDAIHDHADYASGFHFLAGVGALPRVRVTHLHNPWLHMEANYGVSASRRFAMGAGKALVQTLATHVCGTSGQTLEEYGFSVGDQQSPKISVLHCGFDVSKFNAPRFDDRASVLAEFGWPPYAKVVLFCGRLDRDVEIGHPRNHKNSWLAVCIARAALEKDPSIRLIMAGAGEDQRATIESRIAEWGMGDKLRLVGVRDDVGRLMRAADTLLFPSATEGLGMVAVEAQAAGLPVLASTAVPSAAKVIDDLYDTLPLSKTPEEWATALLSRINAPRPDPDACRRAIQASAYSIENSAAALERIYGSRS